MFSQPSHWGTLSPLLSCTGSPCARLSTKRFACNCPALEVTAATARRRLSAAKAIRTGVPCVPVISQCSCSLMVGVYTVSRAVLSAESVATASVPVSDMAHR